MKRPKLLLVLLALHGFFDSPARGASSYTARSLFELPGTPARYLEFRPPTLNNRGEVLYGLLDRRPGVWLPLANYGRPAGINDLTAFIALPNRTILGFNDQGTFFHLSSDPSRADEPLDRIYTVYRGNAAGGETAIGTGYRLEDYPSRDLGAHVRRRAFVVEAITRNGEPVGKWRVDTKLKDDADIPFNWGADPKGPVGVFRGDLVLPLPGATGLPDCANANVPPYGIRALSPGGTMLITRSDACPDLIQTLVLHSPLLGERILARSGVGDPPPINPISRLYAVSDAGQAAGVDESGLWVISTEGRLVRSGVADIQAIRFNDAGQLFVLRTNDVHMWSPDGTLFPLALPWETFGYQPNATFRDVNNRAEFLVSAQSLTDGRTYAVLLSPTLSVELAASTNQTDLGQSLTLTATLTSLSDQLLTLVAPDGPLTWTGTGDWESLSGPEPNPPLTLAPRAVTRLQWVLKSTQFGEGHFSLRFRARVGADEVTTAPAFSGTIRIRKIGPDLLIKRVDDPGPYGGAMQFHPVPVESQTRRADTLLGQPAEFRVVLGNAGDEAYRFVLKAVEDPAPGWRFTYLLENTDITDSVRSPAGRTMPELWPAELITLRLVMTPLTATPNAEASVRLVASFATQPDEPADVVEARTTVRDLAVTFTPERAILGEYVQVKMQYRNSSPTAMSGVRGEIRVFGGGGGYADSEISPENLSTLSSGEVATFTQKFVVTNTGTFRFTGLVLGTQADQRPLRVDTESVSLMVGAVRFLKLDPIQVLPEVTLIQGKSTVLSMVITNTIGVPKSVRLELTVNDLQLGTQTLALGPWDTSGYSKETF
ncbi:MAG: hypothetical protein JNK85_13145, partial [Verrucomicrobiales bacterium]|nr:hypothetical protein [Verrucomicrobiales bacterium]